MTKYMFNRKKFIAEFQKTMGKEPSPQVQDIYANITEIVSAAYEAGLDGDNLSGIFPFWEELEP